MTVSQLRIVVTASDYEEAVTFYRDVLGLTEEDSFSGDGGEVVILNAGRATLEIANPAHADYVDQVEVGERVAPHIRVCFEVDDARTATERLAEAGAIVIAPPVATPWDSLNSRLAAPASLQLTLFEELR